MSAAARALGRPAAAEAVADLVVAAAQRAAAARPGGHRATLARRGGVTVPSGSAPFDAIAVGTDIQRRIGVKTSRDEPLARFTTMRVGGPADLFATVHNAFELRALVRFARSRAAAAHSSWGGGATSSSAIAASAGWSSRTARRARAVDGDRYTAEAGVPMARAATETQRAGLSGLEFGLAIPGTVGGAVWANAGAHESDVATILESARILASDGTEVVVPAAELGPGLSRHPAQAPAEDGPPELVVEATFRLEPADPDTIKARLDDIRRWRQAHQPLGLPSAGSVFRNPPGDSAGRLIDEAGLKGTRIGGAVVSEKHANFIVNDQKGPAEDVRRLGDHVRDDDRRAATASTLEYEIAFLGDWDGWPW